jgi:hypothetical protein
MAKKKTAAPTTERPPITADPSIKMFFHCQLCLDELNEGKAKGESAQSYARLEVGYSRIGLQVRCVRHDVNVIHLDFAGQKFFANTAPK